MKGQSSKTRVNPKTGMTSHWIKLTTEEASILLEDARNVLKTEKGDISRRHYLYEKLSDDLSRLLNK